MSWTYAFFVGYICMSFYYFQDNEFSDVYISTIGVDFVSIFKNLPSNKWV